MFRGYGNYKGVCCGEIGQERTGYQGERKNVHRAKLAVCVCVCGSIILLISSDARGVPYRENDYIAHQHEGGHNATRPL